MSKSHTTTADSWIKTNFLSHLLQNAQYHYKSTAQLSTNNKKGDNLSTICMHIIIPDSLFGLA
ncbi:hypothetical protein VAZ01S_034_00530 [Vibrio azureus NBRC 104587]|uniref:Uncharacterized protein n=1 Tax=Vibrio azureus NBRC 104587 TaxID=1219077 RepID=U3C3F7_9VIBR|nr:hypothetical protein VAZ01S_034_00530 [Vibrio azureus NBRC 104587]